MKRTLQQALRNFHLEWPRKNIWHRSFRKMIRGTYAKRKGSKNSRHSPNGLRY